MEGQEKGPVDHSHLHHSVESLGDSRQLVMMRSHQSEQCDHVWEGVQGTDYNVQNSPDLVCGHCYRPLRVKNCK